MPSSGVSFVAPDQVTASGSGSPATGRERGSGRESPSLTAWQDTQNTVLVLANEDYEGVNPDYPPSVTAPKYADTYVAALKAQGFNASVWDVSRQGVPHHLGVLGHFDAVVWYLRDNRLTQDPEDELTQIGSRQFPDAAVAERQQYLTLSVHDYME